MGSSSFGIAFAFAVESAASCTYMSPASWRRQGVATARGGVTHPMQCSGMGGAQRRAVQAKREWLGNPLWTRGAAPLSVRALGHRIELGMCLQAIFERPSRISEMGRRYGQDVRRLTR